MDIFEICILFFWFSCLLRIEVFKTTQIPMQAYKQTEKIWGMQPQNEKLYSAHPLNTNESKVIVVYEILLIG